MLPEKLGWPSIARLPTWKSLSVLATMMMDYRLWRWKGGLFYFQATWNLGYILFFLLTPLLTTFSSPKNIYIYKFLHLHWPGSKNAIESPSLFLGSATLCLRPKLSWMKGTWKRLWAWRKLGGTGETCCLTTRGILHLWTLSIQFQLPCMAPQLNPRKTRKPFEWGYLKKHV